MHSVAKTTALTIVVVSFVVLLAVDPLLGQAVQRASRPSPDAESAVPADVQDVGKVVPGGRASGRDAAKWGSLRGRFVFRGNPPPPAVWPILRPPMIPAGLPNIPVPDQSLLINAKNQGIENVVVWWYPRKNIAEPMREGRTPPPVDAVSAGISILTFEPRVIVVQPRRSLIIHNSDGWSFHDLAINLRHNDKEKRPPAPVGPGQPLVLQFAMPEDFPVRIRSEKYPWVDGFLLVSDSHYSAVSNEDGGFKIEKLPLGIAEFRCWHERTGNVTLVSRNGVDATWNGGFFRAKINPGVNDMGDIILDTKLFQ